MEQSKEDGRRFRRAPVKWFALALLLTILASGGCTTAWVQERRLALTGLAPKDGVGIIPTAPSDDPHLAGLEARVTGCIQDALREIHPDLRVLPPDDFRKLLLPDLTMDQMRQGSFSWHGLLEDPSLHRRIAPLGLRYLIAVYAQERTRLTDFEWAAGNKLLGAPGPIVHWTWEDATLMEAIVVDARHQRVAGIVQAYASGKSGAGLTLITFPMPLPVPYVTASFPTGVACRGLGEGLVKFLADGSPGEGQAAEQREN